MISDMYDKMAPATAAEVKECGTPNGIRKRFNQRAYRYGHPLIRMVFNMAQAQGLSGEDMYTVLAFEAMKRLEQLESESFTRLMLDPRPPAIVKPDFTETQPGDGK